MKVKSFIKVFLPYNTMLSSEDLERLIAEKTREIQKEKMLLGLVSTTSFSSQELENDKENVPSNTRKNVFIIENSEVSEREDAEGKEKETDSETQQTLEPLAPELERYIRRYLGLPVMLRAGEFSPNNPLLRECRAAGPQHALLALGEYERQRDTMRRIQQRQYREYLDQQAKIKQEEKQKQERERRDQEERERLREERERERLTMERERNTDIRRPSLCYYGGITSNFNKRVDASCQVDGFSEPLSVAVQTDESELFTLCSPSKRSLQAERELSPRAVISINDSFNDRPYKKSSQTKLSEMRHTYMPSILDEEAIKQRNEKAEKEATERRQYYQKELKNQILEQQRIREERQHREKMLEQAEMRRLEEQLRMLKMAQEKETKKQRHINTFIKDHSSDFERKRKDLQKDIEFERHKLRTISQPSKIPSLIRDTYTSQSDNTDISKLPHYYPTVLEKSEKPPFSTNIPENSIFSPNYDVDAYLRKNLNPSKESMYRLDNVAKSIDSIGENRYKKSESNSNIIIEKALIHDAKKSSRVSIDDTLPIPVLRHSPKNSDNSTKSSDKVSEAMQRVESKWKVPIVQKNILKQLPKEEGKNISILTQLGSIRRQLQLEQLKLDNMIDKDDV